MAQRGFDDQDFQDDLDDFGGLQRPADQDPGGYELPFDDNIPDSRRQDSQRDLMNAIMDDQDLEPQSHNNLDLNDD